MILMILNITNTAIITNMINTITNLFIDKYNRTIYIILI